MSIYPDRFNGRTAIITGGASGVGFDTAKRIVAEGGKVAIWDRDPEALGRARISLERAFAYEVDVSDCHQVEKLAQQSFDDLGRVDILIASAGITGIRSTS